MLAANIKLIVENRDYENMVPNSRQPYPEPGKYYITGLQMDNMRGERGWERYIGYIVQVRIKWGAWKTDLVIMRHADGSLSSHENQSFHPVKEEDMPTVLEWFGDVTPENTEDYDVEYTIAGNYPEKGKVVEFKEDRPPVDERPLAKITVKSSDGSEIVEYC